MRSKLAVLFVGHQTWNGSGRYFSRLWSRDSPRPMNDPSTYESNAYTHDSKIASRTYSTYVRGLTRGGIVLYLAGERLDSDLANTAHAKHLSVPIAPGEA